MCSSPVSGGLDAQIAVRDHRRIWVVAVDRDTETVDVHALDAVAGRVSGRGHDVGQGLRGRADPEMLGALGRRPW